jgi:UDP-N-acetyl-D-glucosamine dehydrogenase
MPTPAQRRLEQRLRAGRALVGVVGLGYVGLPLLTAFHDAGVDVLGFDIDQNKIDQIHAGKNYLPHLGKNLLKGRLTRPSRSRGLHAPSRRSAAPRASFHVTSDLTRLNEPDTVLICVPTPLGRHKEPDLSFVVQTARDLGRVLRPGQLVVLESSTYPGTTRDVLVPAMLDASPKKLRLGRDVFVAFSPEREDPGRTTHTTRTIPKLVGGLDATSTRLACDLYAKAIATVVPVSSAEIAETAKLVENIFRGVNIAMVNELKVVLDAMGIDVWEVLDAAATKPFGFMPFSPGPGLGGHCIPIDPFYLAWKAREFGQTARFIELAGEVNHAMPGHVVAKAQAALNARGRAMKGARVLVLGLAYKPDIADVRESPSVEIIAGLESRGAQVDYSDPHVPRTHRMRRHDLQKRSVALTPTRLRSYDAIILATHHKAFDYALIARCARLIIDTRNAFRPFAKRLGSRLVRA